MDMKNTPNIILSRLFQNLFKQHKKKYKNKNIMIIYKTEIFESSKFFCHKLGKGIKGC